MLILEYRNLWNDLELKLDCSLGLPFVGTFYYLHSKPRAKYCCELTQITSLISRKLSCAKKGTPYILKVNYRPIRRSPRAGFNFTLEGTLLPEAEFESTSSLRHQKKCESVS